METKADSKKTDNRRDRILALIMGESGAGKSFFVANLKNALIFDSDLGGGLAEYDARIKKSGSERLEHYKYRDVLAVLRKRLADGSLPETIVIDHVTGLHQDAILQHNPNQDADFGRGGNKATYEWRQIREFARTFDCNLFCIAHSKAEYEKDKQVGKIADGAKNIEGDMHIVLRLEGKKDDKGRRIYPAEALTMKWRRDPEDPRGPVPGAFPFTVDAFNKIHGADYGRKRDAVELAKAESLVLLRSGLERIEPVRRGELETKWLNAAGVEAFGFMTEAQVQGCIGFLNKEQGA